MAIRIREYIENVDDHITGSIDDIILALKDIRDKYKSRGNLKVEWSKDYGYLLELCVYRSETKEERKRRLDNKKRVKDMVNPSSSVETYEMLTKGKTKS